MEIDVQKYFYSIPDFSGAHCMQISFETWISLLGLGSFLCINIFVMKYYFI